MGYSPSLCTTPKMKFIVTAACNQLGYSSSTAYKTYAVLQEGHGPYARIDYTSIVSFSRILTPATETLAIWGCLPHHWSAAILVYTRCILKGK